MANSKGPSSMGSMLYNGKNSLLPPKSPFPSISPSYVNYATNSVIGPKGFPKQRDANSHHQRTSSESFLIEEQPLWLDDLLNEPDTPVRRGGHRRSSSDSFAYVDMANVANIDYAAQDEYKIRNLPSVPSWRSQDNDRYKEFHQFPFYTEQNSLGKLESQPWDSSLNSVSRSGGLSSANDNSLVQNSGSLSAVQEADVTQPVILEKHDPVETGPHDKKASFERKDISLAKPPGSETDTKRAKQQLAQRSRVRKLQYIAELESNVQALQAEGSEVTAELEFLNQQNLILSMENKALKQRLESLAQEQLIKCLEHEVLEREIGRLQTLYQQQQQRQQHQRQQQQQLQQQQQQ